MENRRTKSEIVKMLLNSNIDAKDEEELLNLLVDQPISIDVDKEQDSKKTFGDIVADKLSEIAGSWTFIICFTLFLLSWIIINGIVLKEKAFDEYPFILLNLLLSCIAALQAPIIMMSQNRQAKKDSMRHQNDYRVDLKSELILEELHDKIDAILIKQEQLEKTLNNLENKKGGSKDEIL